MVGILPQVVGAGPVANAGGDFAAVELRLPICWSKALKMKKDKSAGIPYAI
tara:strand:- start:312 stop:464 length:153 start_codon:yes stop_codon:yes gene_type:complete